MTLMVQSRSGVRIKHRLCSHLKVDVVACRRLKGVFNNLMNYFFIFSVLLFLFWFVGPNPNVSAYIFLGVFFFHLWAIYLHWRDKLHIWSQTWVKATGFSLLRKKQPDICLTVNPKQLIQWQKIILEWKMYKMKNM